MHGPVLTDCVCPQPKSKAEEEVSLSEGSGANSGARTSDDDQDDDERDSNKRALGTSDSGGDERAGKKVKISFMSPSTWWG